MNPSDTPPASTPAAPAEGRAKRILLKIVYGFTALVGIVIVIAKIITWGDLPGCDSTRAKDTLSTVFKQRQLEARRYDEISTVAKKDEEVLCKAKLTLKDDS